MFLLFNPQMSWLILLEPMSECLILGAFASWGVAILFRWDSLAFYLIHVLCWFLSDWMLLTIVQVSRSWRAIVFGF